MEKGTSKTYTKYGVIVWKGVGNKRERVNREMDKLEKSLPSDYPVKKKHYEYTDDNSSSLVTSYEKELWNARPMDRTVPQKGRPIEDGAISKFSDFPPIYSRYGGEPVDLQTKPSELNELFTANLQKLDSDRNGFVSKRELRDALNDDHGRYDAKGRVVANVLGEFADRLKGLTNDGPLNLGRGISQNDMRRFQEIAEKSENGTASKKEQTLISDVKKLLPGTMDLTNSKGFAAALDYYFEHLDQDSDSSIEVDELKSVIDDEASSSKPAESTLASNHDSAGVTHASNSELADVARKLETNYAYVRSFGRESYYERDFVTDDNIASLNRAVSSDVYYESFLNDQRWTSAKKYGLSTLYGVGALAAGALTAGLIAGGIYMAIQTRGTPAPILITGTSAIGSLAGYSMVATAGLGYLAYTEFRDGGDFGMSDQRNYYQRKSRIESLLALK